jgi:hypothetical protein
MRNLSIRLSKSALKENPMRKIFCFAFGLALTACASTSNGHRQPSSDPVETDWLNTIALGPSVPGTDNKFSITPKGTIAFRSLPPSRHEGGEVFDVIFLDPKTKAPISRIIDGISIIPYSKSSSGKILVHAVSGTPNSSNTAFKGLFDYASLSNGSKAENHDGLVLLGGADVVSVHLLSGVNLSKLSFTMEGFDNDDASVAIQFTSPSTENPQVTVKIESTILNARVSGNGGSGTPGSDDGICFLAQGCEGATFGVSLDYLCPSGGSFYFSLTRTCKDL